MTDFSDLSELMDAAFQADLARLKQISREETQIREGLADLDRQLQEAAQEQMAQHSPWQAIGVDQAWRKWIMQKRGEANMKLARTLARKAEAAEKVRKSFARNQVSADLAQMMNDEKRRDRNRRAER